MTRRESGFTIVEVLLALAIGVIALAGMYMGLNVLHRWWLSVGSQAEQRQGARAALETVTRDLEMAGYQTTSYGDPAKTGLGVTLAGASEIEVDQQRPDNATITSATPTYAPAIVYYHLATDMRTGRQNLYRQTRTQPGLAALDELVAENVSAFRLDYFGRACPEQYCTDHPTEDCCAGDGNQCCREGKAAWLHDQTLAISDSYQSGVTVPIDSPLRQIRRIRVSLTTVPPDATALVEPAAAGASTLTVAGTAGFRPPGDVVLFETHAGEIAGARVIRCGGKTATTLTGCSGVPATDAGSVVAVPAATGLPPKPTTATASVTPQNLAAADEATVDRVSPAVPTGLAVADPGICGGNLRIKWNANTEQDLAGYAIYFGPTGYFPVLVSRLQNKSRPEVSLNAESVLITKNAERATHPNTYRIRIAAFDANRNFSEPSAEVSGNPDPDVRLLDGAGYAPDSTFNPVRPPAATGLSVSEIDPVTAAQFPSPKLHLAWTAPGDEPAMNGYRIYRSTTPFADGAHIAPSLMIADEHTITPDYVGSNGTVYDDGGVESCTTYYYAVASVNCDETWVDTYVHRADGTGDYAVASGSWQETAAPPAPSLADASPEAGRILIPLDNPLEAAVPDFDRTVIYWSTSGSPLFDAATGTVFGGTPIPDSDCGSAGTFRTRGRQLIVFDDEDAAVPNGTPAGVANPQLLATTYYLLPVAYDRCGNAVAGSAVAVAVPGTGTCSDAPPGEFSATAASSCPLGSLTLSWTYLDPATLLVPGDHKGFRIKRTDPDGSERWLADEPTPLTTWTDSGPFNPGAQYRYAVTAVDCDGERRRQDAAYVLPAGYVTPPTHEFVVTYPGGVQQAPGTYAVSQSDGFDAADPLTWTYHNVVGFTLGTTGASEVTIKRLAVSWSSLTKPDLALAAVGTGTGGGVVDVGGVGSGVPFDLPTGLTAVVGPGSPLPVRLRFVNADGTAGRLTDMRGERLELSLWVTDSSLPVEPWCATPIRVVIVVPRGPVLDYFTQSAPGRFGIDSHAVIGPSATARDTDVSVSYNVGVNVYGTALDRSREVAGSSLGFTRLEVLGIGATAADVGVTPAMPTTGTFTTRPLVQTWEGGDRYALCPDDPSATTYPSAACRALLMPQPQDRVVWYFAVAMDATGNWDRAPATEHGAYAYYQTAHDVCAKTPGPPTISVVSQTTTQAVLAWDPPAKYTDSTAIPADDVLTYDFYVRAGTGDWVRAGTDRTGLSFTHVPASPSSLANAVYSYKVRAKNACMAGAVSSADSNIVSETK